MAVDRPTFSESWYRVADLRTRLHSSAQVHRQNYRGQTWYVVQDIASIKFFRLNEPAYRFIGLLDGRCTIAAAWKACNEELGDDAPTQGEVIELLGGLYTSNLLQTELAGDTAVMFRRYRQRSIHEVRGYLTNLLFVRIPLFDPNHMLDRWAIVFDKVFSRVGLGLWCVLVVAGLCCIIGNGGALLASASTVLSRDNLLLLYLAFAGVKVVHEFGHGFACKRFGRENGTGGAVHAMGIMLLVFMPVPYVDASSAWAFRSKYQRAVVAAAGIYVELAIAASAAIVWANSAEGTTTHAICYNIMFIASISTLLFNINPLLRYDGYFILSDVLEIPNLAQRGREYIYYLVKRYAWGFERARSPAHTSGEGTWLLGYTLASTIYRVIICAAILLFVVDKLFFLGAILALVAIVVWVVLPLGQLLRYLATDHLLARARSRAVTTTLVALTAVATVVGIVPFADHARAEGTVEPRRLAIIYAATDGFVEDVLPSGRFVSAGTTLVRASNPELTARRTQLLAELDRLKVRRDLAARENDLVVVQMAAEQLAVLQKQIRRIEERIEQLVLRAPFDGTFVAPNIDRTPGTYIRRGDVVGLVASLNDLLIRAFADQAIAARLFAEVHQRVDVRVAGRPDIELTGIIDQILPAGNARLPSAALGRASGGSMAVDPQDPHGTKTAEPFFEIRIRPETSAQLLPGQRVVVRLSMAATPLGFQWWQSLRRLLQRRFHT